MCLNINAILTTMSILQFMVLIFLLTLMFHVSAVITEGDTDSLKIPLKLLQAFTVPVISTTGPTPEKTLSTAASAETLARVSKTVILKI